MSKISRRDLLKCAAGLAALTIPGGLCLAADKENPYADAVLVDGEPPLPPAGSFTVAVLPDTQNYSTSHPDIFEAQTNWIVANRDSRNIACVLQLGDITNNNTDKEWKVAAASMNRLDGKVPYFMAPGNHDYLPNKNGKLNRRTIKFNEYFPLSKYEKLPTFGGTYDREPDRFENSYHLFSAGGRDFLVIALEFGPRNDVLRWAGEIADKHKDREAILITHAYMYSDDKRYDWSKFEKKQRWNPHSYNIDRADEEGTNDGEELWTKLVSKHENFILTLNGHVLYDGLGRAVTQTAAGRDVPQMLVNFQMKPNGGDGWLRLLEFHPDRKTIDVVDYSPFRNQRNESPQNKFTLETSPVK
jgi:hypothetical protein